MGALSLAGARRLWFAKQGLGSAAAPVPLPGGWMRNLGGISSYLCLHARCGANPARCRELLATDQLCVAPGVRNCIWLMPREDLPLALRVADSHYRKRSLRELSQAGVAVAEVETLQAAVLEALARGAQTPHQLRGLLPDGLARSLGAAGKKRGHSTALPAALRLLEGEGRVQRRLVGDELASEKLLWSLPEVDPFAGSEALADPEQQAQALARRYFAWAAPASLPEFVSWSGLGVRVARKALQALQLSERRLEGRDEPVWLSEQDLERLERAPEPEGVWLLASLDNLHALRDAPRLFCDVRHHGRALPTMGSRKQTIGELRWMWQRPLFAGSAWIGLWDWDPDGGCVVAQPFDPPDRGLQAEIARACAQRTDWIRDALGGDARMNAIDSEKNQRTRVERMRAG